MEQAALLMNALRHQSYRGPKEPSWRLVLGMNPLRELDAGATAFLSDIAKDINYSGYTPLDVFMMIAHEQRNRTWMNATHAFHVDHSGTVWYHIERDDVWCQVEVVLLRPPCKNKTFADTKITQKLQFTA
jgi:hypothetical protein